MTVIDTALLVTLVLPYVMLMILAGLTTLGKGRPLLFAAGFLLPALWVVGALLGPKLCANEKAWVAAEWARLNEPVKPSFDDQLIGSAAAVVPAIVLRSRRPLFARASVREC